VERGMNRYLGFDAGRFVADSPLWADEIKKLERELESISELRTGTGGVRTSTISDPVGSVAEQKSRIESQIKRRKSYQSIYREAINRLSPAEQEVITMFFFTKGNKGKLIEEFAYSHGYSIRGVYRLKRAALKNLSDYITEEYY
jgi:DNA-directed RNA polymerase specialized sigma subunit